jgi:hypothetical protein
MGSGSAAALAVLGVLLYSALRPAKQFTQALRGRWLTVLAACGLVAAGILLRSSAPQDASLAAKSVGDFAGSLLASLSWPGKPMLLLALISWLPFAAFLAIYLRKRTEDGAAQRFILGIGFWVLFQAGALALYRANSGEGLESRYTDILAFGLLANAFCAIWLLDSAGRLRRWMPVLATVWFAVSGIGLYTASSGGPASSWKHDMEIRHAAIAGFFATGDERYLERAPPYPDARRVAALLQDPAIAPILPAGIRKPLILSPAAGSRAPEFVNGLSLPDLANIQPGVWALPGVFSRFALVPPSTPFEYRIHKASALPIMLLYLIGGGYHATLSDSRQQRHWIVPLPAGRDDQGDHAFVYCPAADCVLQGSSGPSQLAIMEPKEIGPLSIAALILAQWGHFVMAAGAIMFFALVLAPIVRSRKENGDRREFPPPANR